MNAGIASGALIGGWAVANHGFSAPTVAALVISVAVLPVTWLTSLLKPPPVGTVAAPSATTEGSASALPAGPGEEVAPVDP